MSAGGLGELIAKLEAAPEGSRELDEAIANAVLTEYREERLVGSPVAIATYRHPDGSRGTALRYTRSLDAALTLVPEGWYGRVWFGNVPPHIAHNEFGAAIWSPDSQKRESFFGHGGNGKTAALALCIAALKARAA